MCTDIFGFSRISRFTPSAVLDANESEPAGRESSTAVHTLATLSARIPGDVLLPKISHLLDNRERTRRELIAFSRSLEKYRCFCILTWKEMKENMKEIKLKDRPSKN